MMNWHFARFLTTLAVLVSLTSLASLVSGCSTVQSRIKENEHLYKTYSVQEQSQIQNGRIDRGFTPEMVYIAKGNPSERATFKRDGKEILVWKYKRATPPPMSSPTGGNLSTPYGYPGFGPNPSQPAPMFYESAYDNIEFENGKVVRWDSGIQSDIEGN